MNSDANLKRRYDSPRRREQAAATSRLILEAAHKLLDDEGYEATTMAAIAAEAGVSLKTVYLAFETKSGVLRALWDHQLRGAADVAVAEQPWFREVTNEPDPRAKLRLNARNSRDAKSRLGTLMGVIRDAAATDPDIAAMWDHIQSDFYANQRSIVQQLNDVGALRDGLDARHAADILWTLAHPDLWSLLVGSRGWSAKRYEQWLADTSATQLLPEPRRRRSPS
jgi:AcrR family transcriptional regulator